MFTILLYDYAWHLRLLLFLLSLVLITYFKIKKKSYTIGITSLLGVYVSVLILTLPYSIYLESPSQHQNYYALKYDTIFNKAVMFTSFSPKLIKFYYIAHKKDSSLALKLLNEDYCLKITWTQDLNKTDDLISKHFGQRIIIPVKSDANLCPNGLTLINFNLHKFNYLFDRISPTSARHIYRLY